MKRKRIKLELSEFNLGCLEHVLKELKSPTAEGAMTIATAQETVEEMRKSFDAAPELKKVSRRSR